MNKKFTATLQKSKDSGWIHVVWPESEKFFGTRGVVKVRGLINGHPFRASFMATGHGHMLPIKAETRKVIGKDEGDTVEIIIQERLK